ncbi:delta(7)-sterol-C5(6)-desaturase-like [Lytechinus variegatus]|uniref:delta(7)-sterol-C5(6)-desaturase-like n=1 Tax=Lytechinus variegatus TaxID=7654 RepID=UPI001BB1D7FF|nr:delta(7)-sterol-C5(6)-desaturase-like [Lytechinus variegatus]
MGGEDSKNYSSFTQGLRNRLAVAVGSFMTAILATGIRGDWLLFYIQIQKLWYGESLIPGATLPGLDRGRENGSTVETENLLERYHMQGVGFYILQSLLGGFVILYGVGGWLKWYFYIQRRDRAAEWKCQPDRFLTPEDDRLEFRLGSMNMAIGSVLSGILVTYINNGGETKLYYNISDYGWMYFLLSIPVNYVYNEAAAYYSHKAMHYPPWYKRYHKLHHRFKCPTPFGAVAMHPYEFLTLQFLIELPLFFVPMHAGVFIFWLIYGYYYSILDHSGIHLDPLWPWQPAVIFHDNHHKFFHCNFGFNTELFDKLHGTLMRNDRHYSETIFGGQGAPKTSTPSNKKGK